MTNGRKQLVDFTVLLLRIVAGILFIQHGGVKLFGWFGGMPPDGAKAAPMTMPFIAGLLEVVGGALVLLGLFTRPAAFILSGEMAVAYFMVHAPQGTWPLEITAKLQFYSALSSCSWQLMVQENLVLTMP